MFQTGRCTGLFDCFEVGGIKKKLNHIKTSLAVKYEFNVFGLSVERLDFISLNALLMKRISFSQFGRLVQTTGPE